MLLGQEIFEAVWYMAKAGLRYGAVLGGLFGIAIAILSRVSSTSVVEVDTVISLFAIAGGVGVLIGGALGLILGVVDGPILVLLMHRLFHQVSVPNSRRKHIQAINALMVVIGVLLTVALVMGVNVVIGETWSFLLFTIIALIAGGAFWYATGKFADRVLGVNESS